MFSGDKLLGGPQAGIIAGREALLARIRRHPLMRALRADKMTYAALEATLQEYAAGRGPQAIPVARMIGMTVDEIGARAEAIVAQLTGSEIRGSLADGYSTIGGGSAPGSQLATKLLVLTHPAFSPAELEARLRRSRPPIVARIDHDRVVLDLRTVLPHHDVMIVQNLRTLEP
jgi:L-seryl-tRNA(Ser) seleniumtransferase